MQLNPLDVRAADMAPSRVLLPGIRLCSGRKTNVGWMVQNLNVVLAIMVPSYRSTPKQRGTVVRHATMTKVGAMFDYRRGVENIRTDGIP